MKRSGPPERRKPLARGHLARDRQPMARSRLAPISDRRRAENEERREAVLAEFGAFPDCQAGATLRAEPTAPRCDGRAADAHELLRRSQGGSITDTAGMIPVCRRCHDWIGAHPERAVELGVARFRWRAG